LITTTIATTEQYKNGAAVRDRDTMTKTVNAAEWFGEAEGSTQQMQYVVSLVHLSAGMGVVRQLRRAQPRGEP
jgi:hypothetical protein